MYVWLEAVLGNTDSACYSEQCLLFWTVFSALCLRWHRWVRPFAGFNRLGWFQSQLIVSTPLRQHKNATARVSRTSDPNNWHLLLWRKLLKGQWKLNVGILGKKSENHWRSHVGTAVLWLTCIEKVNIGWYCQRWAERLVDVSFVFRLSEWYTDSQMWDATSLGNTKWLVLHNYPTPSLRTKDVFAHFYLLLS